MFTLLDFLLVLSLLMVASGSGQLIGSGSNQKGSDPTGSVTLQKSEVDLSFKGSFHESITINTKGLDQDIAELGARLQYNVASRACASFSNGVASRAIAYFSTTKICNMNLLHL